MNDYSNIFKGCFYALLIGLVLFLAIIGIGNLLFSLIYD